MTRQDLYQANVDNQIWMAYTLRAVSNPNILRYGRLNERNIIRCHIDDRYPGTVLYDIPTYLNLNEYVHKKVKKNQVLAIIRRLISVAEDITDSGFSWANIIWDWNLIFVNPTDDDNLLFMLVPETIPDPPEGEIETLIRTVLSNARYELSENCHYVAHLLTSLNESMNTRDMLQSMGSTVSSLSASFPKRMPRGRNMGAAQGDGQQPQPASWDDLYKKSTSNPLVGNMAPSMPRPCLRRLENGEVIPLSKNVFYIGKDPSRVDYVISGIAAVSRRHASIFQDRGAVYIQDEDSTNGTFLDGTELAPYDRQLLVKGAIINIAGVELQFDYE